VSWIRKIVAPELIEMVAPLWLRRAALKLPSTVRKRDEKALKLRRRAKARKREALMLKERSGRLYPPQSGSRRPEWSSALPNRWSTLNGTES
jgi:hypothetical protein